MTALYGELYRMIITFPCEELLAGKDGKVQQMIRCLGRPGFQCHLYGRQGVRTVVDEKLEFMAPPGV
jgi:hypothetical protein